MAHSGTSRAKVLGASLALALVTTQLLTIRLASSEWPVRVVLPLTIAMAPLALWPYRARLGTWVMGVGLAANLAAILANDGLMPIEQRTVVAAVGAERAAEYETGAWIAGSKDMLVAAGEGNLAFLGDVIIVRAGPAGMAASAGDVVIAAGAALLVFEAALGAVRRPAAREGTPDDGEAEGALPAAA